MLSTAGAIKLFMGLCVSLPIPQSEFSEERVLTLLTIQRSCTVITTLVTVNPLGKEAKVQSHVGNDMSLAILSQPFRYMIDMIDMKQYSTINELGNES